MAEQYDGYLAKRATLKIRAEQLLGAIWYTDGSGWHGYGAGIEGPVNGWIIVGLRLCSGGMVEIDIVDSSGVSSDG